MLVGVCFENRFGLGKVKVHMKKFLINVAAWKLGFIAQLTLLKYKPIIIGVTGSVGKTSTKSALGVILKQSGVSVRTAGGNLNNEIGLPLTILGDYKTPGGFLFISTAIFKGFLDLIFKSHEKYPEVLILEYAADHPGDIGRLVKIASPDIAVITAIGQIPVHIEFYDDVSQVAAEKSKLVKAVHKNGSVILNIDDDMVKAMKDLFGGEIKTYGFSREADVKISNFKTTSSNNHPTGIQFNLEASSSKSKIELTGPVGRAQSYSVAAAVTASLVVGLSFKQATEAIAGYKGEGGRGRLISGIRGSLIIDDSYSASPDSTANALEILRGSGLKKIAVLGDMLELGKHSNEAHKRIGIMAGEIVDILIAVGPQSKVVAKSVKNTRIKKENIYSFHRSPEAAHKLKELIEGGEIILIKGSQSIRTEKVVKAVMKQPERAEDLLVRQYGKWLKS